MKMTKLTTRDIGALVVLGIILVAVLYYLGFYKPLQAEMATISSESIAADDAINVAMTKTSQMKQMKQELDVILSQPKFQITEIAPYDNKNVVLNMLNGVLMASENYTLGFTDPDVQDNGTVRRNITMNFTCRDYDSAKIILRNLTKSNWRCLVRNVTITANPGAHLREREDEVIPEEDEEIEYDAQDIMMNPVDVTATITFFESTKLTKEQNAPLDVTEVEVTEAAEEAA